MSDTKRTPPSNIETAAYAMLCTKAVAEIVEIAVEALGEWAHVEPPYAPEWTVPYNRIIDICLDVSKKGVVILGA